MIGLVVARHQGAPAKRRAGQVEHL